MTANYAKQRKLWACMLLHRLDRAARRGAQRWRMQRDARTRTIVNDGDDGQAQSKARRGAYLINYIARWRRIR